MKTTTKMAIYGVLTIVGICLAYYSWNLPCAALEMNVQGQALNVGMPAGLEQLMCISTNMNTMIMFTAGFILFMGGLGGAIKQIGDL